MPRCALCRGALRVPALAAAARSRLGSAPATQRAPPSPAAPPLAPRLARRGAGAQQRCHATSAGAGRKGRVVFLGTPDVAARVLDALFNAAAAPDACFELTAVVSQPGKPRGRGRSADAPPPSPVAALAAARGMPPSSILTPPTARDAPFLDTLRALAPDLCITAAYGNYLPAAFLALPPRGTLNVHPSLLPRWRGAAPVQRALQAGDAETGVSLAYTVQAMDSGPILAQTRVQLTPEDVHTQLLARLFDIGAQMLLQELPSALDGSAAARAVPQDEAGAVAAPKVSAEEGLLTWHESASVLHNRVRAFEGWPGTRAAFRIGTPDAPSEPVMLKILAARLEPPAPPGADKSAVQFADGALRVTCDDGSVLGVTQLQPPGRRAMPAAAYVAGLRGRPLLREPPPA